MSHLNMQLNRAFPVGASACKPGRGGPGRLRRAAARGFSLIELLIAVALSMVIVTGLLMLYGSVSRTNSEMVKSNELIENGRFALQLLQSDVAHAGFWADIEPLEATAVPDPCLSFAQWPTDAVALQAYKVNLMTIPVQGYAKGGALASCGISDASVAANSNMLVVRHANTCVFGETGCEGGMDTGPHLQMSGCRGTVNLEATYVLDAAGENATPDQVKLKFPLRTHQCTAELLAGTVPVKAPRRKLISNIYYVGVSSGVPTLMRVSMSNGAYSSPEPLVDGIEAFQVEYGVDNLGSNGLPISAVDPINPGDGNADSYVTCPAAGCTLAELANVVAVKLYVLSRNLDPTSGYTNSTSYQLGALTVNAFNDRYKRHVFSTTVRLTNVASRRELP